MDESERKGDGCYREGGGLQKEEKKKRGREVTGVEVGGGCR